MKKICLILLSVVLIFGAFTIVSQNAQAATSNFTVSYDESTRVLTISGTGEVTKFKSSDSMFLWAASSIVVEDGITGLGDSVFEDCGNIQSITLPETLTTIGANAFESCVGLEEITIPYTVTSIGEDAFLDCDLVAYNHFTQGIENSTYGGEITWKMTDHSYTDTVDPQYLKDPATCSVHDIYYKSCYMCGVASETETFEDTSSELLPHATAVEVIDSKYLKQAATCTTYAVYYKSCKDCGAVITDETFEDTNSMLPHSYVNKIEPQYFKEAATCSVYDLYYKSCKDCGIASETLTFEDTSSTKLPHTFVDSFYQAATTEHGEIHKKTCSYCGYEESYELPETVIPDADTTLYASFTIKTSLTLTITVNKNFMSKPVMKFTFGGTVKEVEGVSTSTGVWKFTYDGITPQYLTLPIKMELSYGGVSFCEKSFSVRDYCDEIFNGGAVELQISNSHFDKLMKLLANLLEMGAKMQVYMGVRTNDLANTSSWVDTYKTSTFTTPSSNYACVTEATSDANKIKSGNLVVGNYAHIEINYVAEAGTKLVVTDSSNKKYTYYTDDLTLGEDGTYKAALPDIAATGYGNIYDVKLELSDGTILHEIKYSVNSYVARMNENTDTAFSDVVKALYNYGQSAVSCTQVQTYWAYFYMGTYAGESIRWHSIAHVGNKSLIVSERSIIVKKFDSNNNNIWNTCELREWLNSEFLTTSFSTSEQNQISWSNLTNNKSENTNDKIFLLSIAEATKYMPSASDRAAMITNYVKSQGVAYINGYGYYYSFYYTRNACTNADYPNRVSCVSDYGAISYNGYDANNSHNAVVRPAMWIDLES